MRSSEPDFHIDDEKLSSFGESTARLLRVTGERSASAAAKAVRADLAALRRRRDAAARENRDGNGSGAARWLTDNWYLAEREGRAAASDIALAGLVRTTREGALLPLMCAALLRAAGCELTQARIETFVEGFQRVTPLERAEISILIPCLRAALVSEIARMSAELTDEAGMAAAFTSLRELTTPELSKLLERIDLTERTLRADPAGVFPQMDERTRDMYLREVTRLARGARVSEQRMAACVLRLCENAEDGPGRHVGYWLFVRPVGMKRPKGRGGAYVAANVLLTLAVALLCGFALQSAGAFFLLLLPLSELVKNALDFAAARTLPPRRVPRMELAGGVPPEGKTVCVVSALLTGTDSAPVLSQRLEDFYLTSRDCGKNLFFGLLADLPESGSPVEAKDEAVLEAARSAIEALNGKYGGGFYLFSRPRGYAAADGVWRGYERKRGAVTALAALLLGRDSELRCLAGDAAALEGTGYILTLDADTRLPPGAARELIGAMLHPLNTPVVDEKRGVVTSGRGIIHPRMSVELSAANRSDFARIFAGQGGADPYGALCGEVTMDLFGRGGFAGKGIIDARALLECAKNIPEGRILSHDAVEGALLRGGYMGDTELSDGFPSSPLAYWRRMHRWTRGDWQNMGYIFRRDIADADRWRLFDSLRRSLVAPMSLAAILAGFFVPGRGLALAALAALLALCSRLLSAMTDEALRPGDGRRARYHSAVLSGFPGALIGAAARLALLPMEAWVCISAAAVSLWRMAVSKKGLLRWETAAQSERRGNGFAAYCRAMWPCVPTGLASLLSPVIIGKAAGVLWLLSPLFAMALGREKRRARPLSGESRSFLAERAREMWRYFTEQCGGENNFLPPDNFQEQPPVGAAARTSPTNIGLALCACLTALDLKLSGSEEVLELVDKMLSAVERLPKWKGHLYNWYDTKRLRCLTPRYVSTVDSGNLAAALIAARAGLAEYGKPELAARCERLYEAMDFKPLYDPGRRLFRIGYDATAGKLSEGCYDLLSSEARLTGYISVARGDAPREHWRALSRAQVSSDGFRGMASWSGSMFEYLMPELFLPLYRDSLLWESARFCLYVQKRAVSPGAPWGVSESAFFSLDPQLSYRYKAHGCAGLALRDGMDGELVISPYSSYLALCVSPEAAVRNLRRLMKLRAPGRYGLWEAYDFTPSRCKLGGEAVRCHMVHHLGMSLVAVDNAIAGGAMRRRFMSDAAMRAYRGLLEERVPIGEPVLRRRGDEPQRPKRFEAEEGWERRGDGVDTERPECCFLSNGSYSLAVTESGMTLARLGETSVYRGPDGPFDNRAGLSVKLKTAAGEHTLLPAPDGGSGFSWTFSSSSALFESAVDGLFFRAALAVSASDNCEARLMELRSDKPLSGTLEIEFEPVLARTADYEAHSAFWRLGLHASTSDGALLIRRLPRGDAPELFLALGCDAPAEFRANADGEALDWLDYPLVTASIPVEVSAGGSFALRLALAAERTAEGALAAARRGTALNPSDFADLPAALAAPYSLGTGDVDAAMSMGAALLFPRPAGNAAEGKEALWRFGISGDFPLVCAVLDDEERSAVKSLIARHALLRALGQKSDLVFLTDEGGDYLHTRSRAVREALAGLGLEALLGARGGVHIVDKAMGGEVVAATADYSADAPRRPRREDVYYPLPPVRRRGGAVESRFHEDAFEFTVSGVLPRRAWTNVLTDGVFGFLAADAGIGNMWYQNAREGRINRWVNDPLAASGPETLEMAAEHGPVSLFAAEDGYECRVTFGFGWARWEKTVDGNVVRTTAFVPEGAEARVLLIEGAAGEIRWKTGLTLANDERDARFVTTDVEDGVMTARNPRSRYPDAPFRAVFSSAPSAFTCDLASWLRGEPGGERGAGLTPCFASVLSPAETHVVVCGCGDEETLRELASPHRARLVLEETRAGWNKYVGRLRVRTPDGELDRYLNGWAAYQTVACRLAGRTSLYQSGGAFGFRDQLQDAVNLLLLDPALCRRQILACCAHQYGEGDVMHWWHPTAGGDKGVRTRCSDDLLWLPWALCEYVEKTGDAALCGESAGFLVSPPLSEGEQSRYETPKRSETTESVLAHAARALALALGRGVGENGLLLMGSGDWNDGMDAVGGESVWLSFFFAHTARRFAALMERCGRKRDAAALLSASMRLGRAADRAWDGDHFIRGFWAGGRPLGGGGGAAGCQLDSIAQSWACFVNETPKRKRNAALTAAAERLFDRESGLVRLFDPPFTDGEEPGYIKSYGPGFRENGGQYTHGALWLAMALFREGRAGEGFALLRALLPKTDESYGAEPFVLSADRYSNPERFGEAGWSWYTGAAGWFFRVAAEELLGLRLENGVLTVSPRLPEDWAGYGAVWTDGEGREHAVRVTGNGGVVEITDVNK